MIVQKKILVADDDPGILDAIEMMLEFEGYQVSSTSDGSTILDIKDNYPDLLLLDVWMSGQDGRVICKELKRRKSTKNIPVILVSASTDLKKSARESGADDFLEKPFSMTDLLNKIALHLKQA